MNPQLEQMALPPAFFTVSSMRDSVFLGKNYCSEIFTPPKMDFRRKGPVTFIASSLSFSFSSQTDSSAYGFAVLCFQCL